MGVMAKIDRDALRSPSVLLLIAMNLIPLVGVLVFGWNIGYIMLLYWMETIVIGLFNIPKILSSRKPPQGSTVRAGGCGLLFIAVFFTIHYGGFNAGHFFFLNEMFDLPPINRDVLIVLGALTLSHGFSLMVNWFGKREFENRDPSQQMFMPYGRVIVMHIVIILGGFLALAFNGGLAVLILLIALKTIADLFAHLKGHEWMESQATQD